MTASNKNSVVCYIALGSNLGDSYTYLENAIKALNASSFIGDVLSSKFYQSKPHGPQDQPDYLNAALRCNTSLTAEKLLDLLQGIENDNMREREGVVRWGARTLDLDLLFYADKKINSKRLIVPHPRICERAFVLLPLQDLGASLKRIGKTTIKECIEKLSPEALADIKELKK